MAKVNRKRFRLGSVIDRLHVENAISSKKNNRLKRDQDDLEEFINPSLLHLNKTCNDVISVRPDVLNSKTRNQVYSRSRPSISTRAEGGRSACELCGNQAFKVFPKAVEICGDNGKVSRFLKQVCRKCFAPVDSFKSLGKSPKKKVRPYYEPPLTGVVGSRASKSWHFVRRDFVSRKKLGLHYNQCNENEFREKYLSSASSGESDNSESSESDEEYEDFEEYIVKYDPTLKDRFTKKQRKDCHKSPNNRKSFMNDIRNQKGYQDHLALRNEWCRGSEASTSPNTSTTPSNDEDETPNTSILRPKDIDKIGVLLEDQTETRNVNLELAVNQTEKEGSTLTLPINIELSPLDHSDYCHPSATKDKKLDTFDSMKNEANVSSFTTTPDEKHMEIDTHEYEKIEKELLANIELALEILLIETSDKVSQLLNPLNYIDNEFLDGFDCKPTRIRVRKHEYDMDLLKDKDIKDLALPSYDKGVCRLVTVLNIEKGMFKDHSHSSTYYDSEGICRKKQELPIFVELDDDKYYKRKSMDFRKKEIDSLITKYAPVSPLRSPGNDSFNSTDNEMDSSLTLKELQDKFWPNRLSAGATKENICDICHRTMLSSSVYTRYNAPPKILLHFKEYAESIRACKACLLTPNKPSTSAASAVTIVTGEKRPLLAKDGSVAAKKSIPGGNIRILPKVRRFSRFHETPQFTSRSVSPKVVRQRTKSSGSNCSINQKGPSPKVTAESSTSCSSNAIIGDDIGKYFMKGSSPLNPLGINSFGRLNLKVVQNPNETDLKTIAQNCKTKYVIVQTAPNSGESKVQKLSSDKNPAAEILGAAAAAANGETKLGSHGDITINGQKYKIDTEFKLNDLMKDTENTILSAEAQKDLLNRLPGLLKRTQAGVAGGKSGTPTHFKIVNVVEGSPTMISSSMSSPNSSTSRPQAIIVQSLAPGQQQQANSATPQTTKIIPNLKGNVFQTAEFNVGALKKFQNIAPAPPKGYVNTPISSSYVIDGGVVKKTQIRTGAENSASTTTTTILPPTVLPRNDRGQFLERKRILALNTTNLEGIPDAAGKNAKLLEELKQKGVKNFVEIRLPPSVTSGENTVNLPSRNIILNSPVTADAAKFLTPVATSGVSAGHQNIPEIILTDITVASPSSSVESSTLDELKSPMKSPNAAADELLLTSTEEMMTSSARNSPDSSTAAAAALSAAIMSDKETSPSLVKAINASVTTKMSATSTSSLVKSINELGASLNVPQSNSPTSTAGGVNNRTLAASVIDAIGICDSSSSAVVVAVADTNTSTPPPPVNNSSVDSTTIIAMPTDPITFVNTSQPRVIKIEHSSNEAQTSKASKSSFDVSDHLKTAFENTTVVEDGRHVLEIPTNVGTKNPSVAVTSTVLTASDSIFSSISEQIQQQMKATSVAASKPMTSSSSPIKVSVQKQNGGKVVTSSNQQILELSNGLKIVGSLLNTDGIKAVAATSCLDEATKITSTRKTPPKASIITQSNQP